MTETLKIDSFSPSTLMSEPAINQGTSEDLALSAARAADDRKGGDILVLQVSQISYLADYFVTITGFSKVQVRAISQSIEEQVERELHRRPLRVEGKSEGSWILLDYGDVIVHIMMPQEREFYNLEAFWGHAERINFASASKEQN